MGDRTFLPVGIWQLVNTCHPYLHLRRTFTSACTGTYSYNERQYFLNIMRMYHVGGSTVLEAGQSQATPRVVPSGSAVACTGKVRMQAAAPCAATNRSHAGNRQLEYASA